MRFAGKVAVVTGAAQGIGETYSHRLAAEGAGVAVVDINAGKGRSVAEAINATGGHALFVACDVSDEASCQQMADAVYAHFGRIDYLVNNAAIYAGMRNEPLMSVDLDYFDKIMRVNFYSVLLVTRAVAPKIAQSGGGAIVNQSSTNAYSIAATAGYYGISKLAVNGLTAALSQELGEQNIRVNTLAPGVTDTQATSDLLGAEVSQAYASRLPLKRLGTTDDQASALLFLLSDDAAFITGQTLCVDGGLTRRI